MTGPRWAVFATVVGALLIAVSLYTLTADFPSLIRDWQEVAGLVFGGACLSSAHHMIINRKE